MNWLLELVTNPFLITSVASWFIAQLIKTIIYAIINKKIDLRWMFSDGAMPSGHSATVSSLAALSALRCGFGSFQFAATAILAIIVCHDAMGVRLETGKQAEVLLELIEAFEWLKDNQASMRETLENIMPDYKKDAQNAAILLEKLAI